MGFLPMMRPKSSISVRKETPVSDTTRRLEPTDEDTDIDFKDLGRITDEDRKEINADIDKALKDTEIAVTDETFTIKGAKRGILFVAITWIMAVVAVAGTWYFAAERFAQRQVNLSSEAQAYLSAEGRLIEELKRESETRLAEKDREISKIQTELSRLDQEGRELREGIESRIQAREEELRNQIESELALERSRLAALGQNREQIDAGVRELEAEKTRELNELVASFRSQAEEEIRSKEEELAKSRALTQEILQKTSREREDLMAESSRREAELVSRFEDEKAELEEQTGEILSQLSELSAVREREALIDEQIIGSYGTVDRYFRTGDYASARSELEGLRSFFQSPSINALPTIARRRDTELFIIDRLLELTARETAKAESTPASIIEAAEFVVSARNLAEQGEEAYASGDTAGARNLYRQALEEIPTLYDAYRQLTIIEGAEIDARTAELITTGTRSFEAGNILDAVNSYTEAVLAGSVGDADLVEAAVKGIGESYRILGESGYSEKDAVIADLRSRLDAALSKVAGLEREADRRDADVVARNSTVTALRKDVADRDARIKALTAEVSASGSRVSTLERDVSRRDETIRGLESRVTALENRNAGLTGELSDLRSTAGDGSTELSALTEEYESRLADLEAVRRSEVEALRIEAAQMERRHGEDLAALSEQYDTRLAGAGTAGTETAGTDELEYLEESLAGAEAQIEVKNRQIEQLGADLSRLQSLQTEYVDVRRRADRLIRSGDPGDRGRAWELVRAFMDRQAGTLFPGLAALVDETVPMPAESAEAAQTAADIEGAVERGADRGRNEVLGSLFLYTNYLDTLARGTDRKSEIGKQAIEESARNDLLYTNLLNRIERLSAEAARKALTAGTSGFPTAGSSTRLRLIGNVLSQSGGIMRIDPFAGADVSRGSTVVVKRRSGDAEVDIAQGLVSLAAAQRVEAEIIVTLLEGAVPVWGDLVYVEVR